MNFEFTSVGKIVFGRGKIAQLGELARAFGASGLIVYNGDEPGRDGPVDRAAASLCAAGVKVVVHRQRGEPKVADVDAGIAAAKEARAEVLIAVGGGSAIDACKAVAGIVTNGGEALDYMEVIGKGMKISRPALPWIAVPTTAGTGAEVTKNAVIGSPERKFKASIRSEHLLARVALIDPELQVGVPKEVTAASGMDALCQCIEAYVSNGANGMTDAIALAGIRAILPAIEVAYRDGTNLDAREGMAMGALCSGIALANAGLGAVHGFAAPLGANFPVPHGVVCARLVPEVIAANVEALDAHDPGRRASEKYARFGGDVVRFMMQYPRGAEIPHTLRDVLVGYTRQLVTDLAIPPLSAYGVREEHVPAMVELAKKASSMRYNPVVLADDVLANILRSAL